MAMMTMPLIVPPTPGGVRDRVIAAVRTPALYVRTTVSTVTHARAHKTLENHEQMDGLAVNKI